MGKKLTDATENIVECLVTDNLGDLGWGQTTVDAEEVRGKTSNVGGGHRGSRDGLGLSIVPGGSDVQARSPDVDGGTPVGELGLYIRDSRSSDSDRLPNTGGGEAAGVLVIVSCGYGDGNTAVVKLKIESFVSGVAVTFHTLGTYRYDSFVESVRGTAAQAHRSNGGVAGPPCFLGDPVNAGDAVVRRRGSVTVGDKKEGKEAYTSEFEPEPWSLRTFTATTLEAFATP